MKFRRASFLLAAVFVLSLASVAWSAAELEFNVYPEKFVEIGEDFYYSLHFKNVGDATATGIEVTPTFDSHITTSASTISIPDIEAGDIYFANIEVSLDGSTSDGTLLVSSFELSYTAKGKEETATVEATNRAYDHVEHALDSELTTEMVRYYDFSPDGSKVVYTIKVGSANGDIYIINVDGTGKEQLTDDPACEDHVAFSPDGTKIAYKTNVNKGTQPSDYDTSDDYNADIYLMDLASKSATQLTTDGDCQRHPVFSPNGSKVLFNDDYRDKAEGDTGSRLAIVDIEKGDITPLEEDYYAHFADFTPDGQWVVYNYYPSDGDASDLWKIKVDGTGKTQLTFTDTFCEQYPQVSPDGTKILFKYYYSVDKEEWRNSLAIMDIDGYNMKILLDGRNYGWPTIPRVHRGVWSPDGRWILFGWNSQAWDPYPYYYAPNTWVMDSRGIYKGLMSMGYYEYSRKWSPAGDVLAFIDGSGLAYRTDISDVWLIELDTSDADSDDLAIWEEDVIGTDPEEFDTDGDSAGDGREFDQGSDPLVDDCPRPPVLSAEAGDKKVELSWEPPDKTGDIESYNVYGGTSEGGPYDLIEAEVEGTSYTHDGLDNGTTYYYVVTSVDEDGFESGDSNEVSATPEAPGADDDVSDDDTGGDDDDGGCGCAL